MGLFIKIKLNKERCASGCAVCAEVCPVSIFQVDDGVLRVVAENEDECTFCELCLERCPSGALEIAKNY